MIVKHMHLAYVLFNGRGRNIFSLINPLLNLPTKVYSEQNPRLGHFTYVFKQLIKYIIAARWFIVAGIRE